MADFAVFDAKLLMCCNFGQRCGKREGGKMGYDPATVAAFLDGTLDEMTARRIAREALSDPVLAAEIRRTRRLLADSDEEESEAASVPGLISDRVDARQAGGRKSRARMNTGRRWISICLFLIAAAPALWLGKSQWFAPPALLLDNDHLVAAGALADALDNASTSVKPDGDGFRIDMTFLNAEGHHCRGFESGDLSGIACRTDGRWQIQWALVADRAGLPLSPTASLADAEADLRATRAFNRAQEDAARREGWAE